MYTLKSKNDETRDHDVLLKIVQNHADDLTNRYALINYFIRNNIQNINGCKDMSQEKCGRKTNTRICQWVPGADELGEWAVKPWNERKEGDDLPEYVGANVGQKPRGCYPISKVKIDMKAIADVKKQKEGVAFGLKFPPKDDLTEAELAEAELVKAQKKKMPLTESQKEKMQIKQQQYADMLKKLRAGTSKTDNTTYETKGKGGRKRKTRKRKTRKRKRRQKKTRKKKRRRKRRKN